MSRALLTLSGFGFGASAGVAALVMPIIPAVATALALLCCFAALQQLRDQDVAAEVSATTRSGR